jgi:hypothetical protein
MLCRLAAASALREQGGPWTQGKEELFHVELLRRLEDTETKYNEMQDRLELVGGQRFEEAFGFTLSEARALRTSSERAASRASEAEVMLNVVRGENFALLDKLARVEAQVLELTSSSEAQVVEERSRVAQLVEVVARLEREAHDRDESTMALADASKQSESAERQSLISKEFEFKKVLNKAMKDNAILISINQRLENDLLSKSIALSSLTAEVDDFKTTQTAEFNARVDALSTKMGELETNLRASQSERSELCRQTDELQIVNAGLETENCELEERLRVHEDRAAQLTREIEKLSFDIDNANETNDNLYSQAEGLLQERESFLDAVRAADARSARLVEELQAALKQGGEASIAIADLVQQSDEAAVLISDLRAVKALSDANAVAAGLEVDRITGEVDVLTLSCVELKRILDETKTQLALEQGACEKLKTEAVGSCAETARMTTESAAFLHKLASVTEQLQSSLADAAASEIANTQLQSLAECLQLDVDALRLEADELSAARASLEASISREKELQQEVEGLRATNMRLAMEARDHRDVDNQKAVQLNADQAAERIALRTALEGECARTAILEGHERALCNSVDQLTEELRLLVEAKSTLDLCLAEEHLAKTNAEALAESLRAKDNVLRVEKLDRELEATRADLGVLEDEMKDLRREFAGECGRLQRELDESTNEVARLCGQHNNKQRIQQHMKLKKELEDQALLVRHQIRTIYELTAERDAARDDARRQKQLYKDAGLAISSVNETLAASKRRTSDPNTRKLGETRTDNMEL